MERLKFRCCGARVALVLGVFLGGCQVTLPPDLVIQCSEPGNACPPGYECNDDVCVRDGVPDGGGSDASPDATFDGDSRDSGPGDARVNDGGGEPDARGDADPPDADAGPPPPPPLALQIGGDGNQTVDGVAVGEGGEIHVVGTHSGESLCFGSDPCSEREPGMYVATFRTDLGALDYVDADFFASEDELDITPAGIAVLSGGQLVVGGTHTGTISNTEPPVEAPEEDRVGAFVLTFDPERGEPVAATTWSLSSSGNMRGIDAQGMTWCTVGLSGLNPAEPGFLVCSEVGEERMEHGLGGGAANDLDMSGETWQMAWSVVGLSRATAASFDAASGVMNARYRSDEDDGTSGELVATNGSNVVLVSRASEQSYGVLVGIREDETPGMGNGQTYMAALGATGGGSVSPRDMVVAAGGAVHIVGQLVGQGTRLLSGLDGDGGRGFYAAITAPDVARVESPGGGNTDFRAIAAAADGAIVIGGQGTGPFTFLDDTLPVDLNPDNLDGFIMVIPPSTNP